MIRRCGRRRCRRNSRHGHHAAHESGEPYGRCRRWWWRRRIGFLASARLAGRSISLYWYPGRRGRRRWGRRLRRFHWRLVVADQHGDRRDDRWRGRYWRRGRHGWARRRRREREISRGLSGRDRGHRRHWRRGGHWSHDRWTGDEQRRYRRWRWRCRRPWWRWWPRRSCRPCAYGWLLGYRAAQTPAFKWVNTALGNIKAAITGTYRSINSKHVPRYLAEFEYRFNRRYDLAAMIPRLSWAAVRTPPMPYRLLKLAEVHA